MSVVNSGWRVTLSDGVFAGLQRPLMAATELEQPPDRLNVYLCPCCNQVVAMTLDDPRNVELRDEGVALILEDQRHANVPRAPVVYELRLAGGKFAAEDPERFAVYEQAAVA